MTDLATPEKVLLVRMDKIGDLVLSLNSDQAPALRGVEIVWLVSQGLGLIAQQADPPRAFKEWSKFLSRKNLFGLIAWLKAERFQTVIVLYAPWWVGLATILARIPVRIGRRSRWDSFLFFNYGVRQSRKLGDLHESDANLDLLTAGYRKLGRAFASISPAPIRLLAPPLEISPLGLKAEQYFVVHPGMAGSALNWPTERYAELIRVLTDHLPVVVTGTAADRVYLEPLQSKLKGVAKVLWFDGQLSLPQLFSVLNQANAVIAPSTGVLHLAAALGRRTVGLYSPVPVQRPSRWGARGPKVATLTSPATPEEAKHDPGQAMAKIEVRQVLSALQQLGANV